jgi:2-polyprenyl-3-methyl-5-hydroxy-6-metoxy-1,4-benzoquinol methylase
MTVSAVDVVEALPDALPVVLQPERAPLEPVVFVPPARPAGPSLITRAATGILNLAVDGTLLAAGAAVGAQVGMRFTARTHPGPMPRQFAAVLDHPARLAYRKPDDLLGLVGILGGMTVLDLGCGTGLFTVEVARAVGAVGHVHAVDLQKSLLDATRDRLSAAGVLDRCMIHAAGAYSLPLENQSVDVALIVATLGEIPDRLHALLEVFRVVKPGGRVAISEEAPHPAYLTARGVRRLAEDAGFIFTAKSGTPFSFTSVFTRP